VTDAQQLELIDRARRGDTEAFGDLVDRHRHAVYRAALAALRSPEEAEDVAQETFVTAYQKLDTFRGEASFKTWVVTIAWRKALDRRSSLSRWWRAMGPGRGAANEQEDPVERVAAAGPSQEDELLGTELAGHIRRLVARLPAKLRDPLLLVGSGDHSYEEAAAVVGAPVGTVKWRVSEARRLLKRKLARLGYDDD
jgi:RNA polymerase sigma-70 factor (ECF subfamily)